jgi:NadR type nicotinamide-nucleotide adenylyltransferase
MIHKVAIIGPECTGKTTLAQQLAVHFSTVWVPEYARDYVEQLDRKYTFDDVIQIARHQEEQIHATYSKASRFVFFDTDLIITKVWFDVVYKQTPDWIDLAIKKSNFSCYLLCDNSLPWNPDNVRENGGEMRNKLFEEYKRNLDYFNFKFQIISGIGTTRFENASRFLKQYY